MFSARILMFCFMLGLAGPVFAQQDTDDVHTTATTADEVVDAATLKLFVKEAVEEIKSSFAASRHQDNRELALYFREQEPGTWRSGSLYLFIMYDDGEVVFNEYSPALEGTTLDITDRNGCNVGDEIVRAVNGEARECKGLGLLPEDSGGFVEYLWDNPDDPNDDDSRFEAGDRTISPGFSPKLSYVEALQVRERKIIAGAGIYPPPAGKADGGGCAVCQCPLPGDAPRGGAALGLLLVALALLPVLAGRRGRKTRGS